jgi:hypothetical protein
MSSDPVSRRKATLEEPQSHTDTDGGATARQIPEPVPSSHEQPAAQKAEPSTSHTQNDGGGS